MTNMIPGGTLGYMRAMTGRFLTDTCRIEQRAMTRDEYGTATQTAWTLVEADVPCRVINLQSGLSGSAETVAGRESTPFTFRLICPAGTALAADQRVTLASDGSIWHIADVKTVLTDETDTQATIVRTS
jgi:head-tail adaptor